MPHDLPKAYDPGAIEPRWAEYWVREKLFDVPTPRRQPGAPQPFTLLLPPPNVTGNLHMGHMLEHTEIDIIVRWQRMSGEPYAVAARHRPRRHRHPDDGGAPAGAARARTAATWGARRSWSGCGSGSEQYGGAILQQMKRLGDSVDWSREYFTMDERLSRAVREAFVRLYEEGLIYRGKYIVNWCPRCITAVSDLEVVHEETQGKLWEIRYPVIGTR